MIPRTFKSFVIIAILALNSAETSPAGPNGTVRSGRIDSESTVQEVLWKSPTHSAAGTAISFLAEEAAQGGRAAVDHIVTSTEAVPGGFHVRLKPTLRGIPLFRTTTVISINDQNEVVMVARELLPEFASPDVVPAFDPVEAVRRARGYVQPRGDLISETTEAELVLYRNPDDELVLAYRSSVVCGDPMGDWEVLIDARSGELLLLEDRFVRYEYATGSGYVYRPDPVSVSGAFYGDSGFEDNDDADSDSLTHYRSLVTLDSILVMNGEYRLQSPYFSIRDIEAPHGSEYYRSASPDGFRFTRSQQGFEAVNIFYHATESYRYLRSLGFDIPSLRSLEIDPHGYYGEDNSHYSPSGNWIAFGEGGVDDAEDAGVIWHEYAHAIQYNINPEWGGGEAAALGEGFGDYWAASYARSLGLWSTSDREHDWLFHWDGHNSFWGGRAVNDARTYPFGNLSSHDAGQIWASALISIQDELGREVTDRLILKSQYYLGYGVTARDAAKAILQADRDLYDGRHLSVLAHWLGTVKRFLDPAGELPSIRHTPVADTWNTDGPYTVSAVVSPGGNISVLLCWKSEGTDADTVAMTTDDGETFTGQIPGSGAEGRYEYFLIATDARGNTALSPYSAPVKAHTFEAGGSAAPTTPDRFELSQNFPNPFNPSTTIAIDLAEDAAVVVTVYDLLGREVSVLVDDIRSAGHHEIQWTPVDRDGSLLATGAYIYRMQASSLSDGTRIVQTRKMVYVR